MYPYQTPTKWIVRNRYMHLVDGIRQLPALPRGEAGATLLRRLRSMERLSRVLGALIALLSLSLVATAFSWLADQVGPLEEAEQGVNMVVRVVAGLTTALTLAVFVVNRLLGQLEADVLVTLQIRE